MNVKSILQAVAVFAILVLLLWLAFYVLIFGLAIGFVVALVLMVKRLLGGSNVQSMDFNSMKEWGASFNADDLKNRFSDIRSKVSPSQPEVIEGECEEVGDKPADESAADSSDDQKAS